MSKDTETAAIHVTSKTGGSQFLRVLFVEDLEDDALLIVRHLKKGGYNPVYERVETAADMKNALLDKQWDIILCDYNLPEFDAPSAIAFLKESNINIPMIIISGAIGEETAVDCMHLGARDYIMKNNLSRLCPSIARELEEADLRFKRIQIEESLRKSEEMLRLITENMSDMIRVTDFQGNNLYASPSHYKGLGYTMEERVGKSGLNIVHPDDLEMLINKMTEGMASRQRVRVEYRVKHADGHYVWLDTIGDLIRDDQGNATAALMCSRDISDKKMAEDTLKKSEERYRTILEDIDEGYYEKDLNGTFTFVNEAQGTNMGYAAHELIGMNYRQYCSESTVKKITELYRRVYETGEPFKHVELAFIGKDGATRIHETSAALIRDDENNPVGFRGIVQNITKRKQVEEALRRSEEKYRGIIENMQEGYFELDLAGHYTFVNDATCRLLGYSREELIGKNSDEFTDKDNVETMHQIFMGIYRTQKSVSRIEYVYTRKDGMKGFAELSASLLRDEEDNPSGFQGVSHDITERKRAEEIVRESEKRYRMIVENMHDSITTLDMNFKATYQSPSEVRLTGYTPEEAVQLTPEQIMTPESRAIVRKVIEEAFIKEFSGEPVDLNHSVNMDLEIYHKNGHTVWQEVTASFARNENGKPEGIMLVSRDITERKRMEAALRESEKRYRMIVENMHDTIWTMDMNFNYTYQSPSEVHVTGYTPDEVSLIPIDRMMTPESFAVISGIIGEEMERELSGEPIDLNRKRNMEIEVYHKNGGTVWLEVTATFLRDEAGKPTGILMAGREITGRKIMEEAIRESELKYRSIFINSTEGIFQNTPDGKFQMVNPALLKILGYDSEEDLMKSSGFIKNSCVEPSIPVDLYRLLQKQDYVNDFEMKAYRKNGDIIDVSLNAHRVCDHSGKIKYFEGRLIDVTEKKRIEELKMAKELAEHADNAKSEFLANMSHEIRTPMNAIVGFTSLAMKQDMSTKVRDYLKKIDHSADSLLVLINDILDFSKVEAGQLNFESIDFNLQDVFSKIGDMYSIKSAQKGVELIVSIAEDVPCELVGDPLRLEQILINLTSNAIKFTESGHIFVRASLVKKDEYLCRLQFTCSDTGIGIAGSQLSKIFNAFSQADSSVTRKYGGTGLGLAISKRLVEMMGGEISVQSEIDRGSTFTFTAEFTLHPGESESHFTVPADLQNLKVLVVDDNQVVRDVFVEQVESFKFEATGVESGQAAIQELERAQDAKEKSYDLVLMDWLMKGFDGIEAAKKIKQNKKLSKIPSIILITAFGREDMMKKAEAEKIIDAFVMKPTNQSILFNTILEVFGKNIQQISAPDMVSNDFFIKRNIEGAKILLVEDNAINQQLVTEILESAGLKVEIANNGQEAVDAVKESVYDIVLMDVQMPVMSGYEAAKLIRQDGRFNDLPLIATTAYAMSGARERCLKAGMNDYVSKPIDPIQLFSVFNKWIKPGLMSTDEKIQNKCKLMNRQDVPCSLPQRITGIDIASGLNRANGNQKLYSKLLLDFAEKYPAIKDEIKNAVHQGDRMTAERLAHTLKGVAGNISAAGIQAAAHDLEAAIRKNKAEAYDRLLSELDRVLQPVLLSIKCQMPTTQEKKCLRDKPIDSAVIAPIMLQLAGFLRKNDPNAQRTMAFLKETWSGSIYREEINDMDRHVDNFDFDIALTSLEKIAKKINVSLNG